MLTAAAALLFLAACAWLGAFLFTALRGELSRAEAAALIKQSSRRYAKRQLTWFGRNEKAHWIRWDHTPDFDAALSEIERLLSTE